VIIFRGSRATGRPRDRWWSCVQTDIDKSKITNWEDRADWEKGVKKEKKEEEEKK